ncbi:19650_t:CDS:1, partial [Racocetra persica]
VPCFVINRTGPLRVSSKTKLFIPWMILGYDKFPTKPLSELDTGYTEHTNTTDNADTWIQLQIPVKGTDYCWIGTNTLFCDDNPSYELGKTNIFVTYHFCSAIDNYNSLQACYKLNPEQSPLKFRFNYTAVLKSNDNQIKITKDEWKSRKRNFPQIRKRSIFTGEKWNLSNDNKLVFASILYPNTITIEKRYSLLLNINPRYPIIKSLVDITENPK